MRRGQTRPTTVRVGFTKGELVEAGGLSPKSFDTLRKVARIKGPPHGQMHYVFTYDDLVYLIRTAEGGRYSLTGRPIAAAWRELLAQRGQTVEPPPPPTRGRTPAR